MASERFMAWRDWDALSLNARINFKGFICLAPGPQPPDIFGEGNDVTFVAAPNQYIRL